ncbi:hypothetical protein [Dactylosporangium sp. NPDC049140]|uniref:hypothetical protein n=1 Tax=Dactylosporangium sp. NPDC049140 TaxID=3155647 RepID=UPI0033D61829
MSPSTGGAPRSGIIETINEFQATITAEIAVNVTAIADAASAGKATADASHGSVATLAELSGNLRRTVQRFRY